MKTKDDCGKAKVKPRAGRSNRALLWALLPLAWSPGVLASAAGAPPRIYDVRQFGAKGDGKTVDTPAIQKALDECGKAGGGIVRLTAGTYLSKPIFLHSKITLELEAGATLLATDERQDYLNLGRASVPASPIHQNSERTNASPSSASFFALVNGKGLTGITIRGQGTIDGAGARWWGPALEAKRTNQENPGYTLPRPRLVLLAGCKNVRVEGVTLVNSPSFHLVPRDCEDVVIENVTITAPADSPNTDGIDPSISRRVRISKCRIDVGDDNIAIKSGKPLPGRAFACEDITVTDCVFLHGHGLSIGSETAGGVRRLTVRRCTFEGTENGIRIKSPRGRGGTVEEASYSDITMKAVDPAITITCYYPKVPAQDSAQPLTPETPIFRNLRLKNITATCTRSAGIIAGLPESPVSDVALENVRISAATTGLALCNAKGIQFKNVQITAEQGPPFIIENAQVEGLPDEIRSPKSGF